MNILFLIGNGFDLNLGMKTKYCDFYKYYTSTKSENIAVEKLKNSISSKIENWSNLELELGRYTKKLESEKEFLEIYEDLCDELANYLEKEENKYDFSKINSKNLYKYFSSPEDSLPLADKIALNSFKNNWGNNSWNLNIITFNYTQSLEKSLKYDGQKMGIGSHHTNYPIILQKIEHIHGYINERMVLGVNDISQVSNNTFHKNENVLVDLIKNKCNQAQRHMIDEWCEKQISKADIIYIFGSSIGNTDKIWWNLIGKQLKRDFRLVLFSKGKNISPRRPQRKIIEETQLKNNFLAKAGLNGIEKEHGAKKIFVATNTNMFDLKIKMSRQVYA